MMAQLNALSSVAYDGSPEDAKKLLDEGSPIEQNGVNSPLHRAAIHGNVAMVRFLLAEGANVNIQKDGWSPLHLAAFNGHEETTIVLLDAGADPSLKTGIEGKPGAKRKTAAELAKEGNSLGPHLEIAEKILEYEGAGLGIKPAKR